MDFSLHAQLIEELLQVSLHLNTVVIHFSNCEYPQKAVLPDFVPLEQEGQQQQQPAVMHDPPHINVPLGLVRVARKPVDSLRHQHCQLTNSRHTYQTNKQVP